MLSQLQNYFSLFLKEPRITLPMLIFLIFYSPGTIIITTSPPHRRGGGETREAGKH